MASATPRSSLPAELILEIWRLHAAFKYNEACRRGALCQAPELCAEARSPNPAVALVSKRRRELAALNPQLFSFIRIEINFEQLGGIPGDLGAEECSSYDRRRYAR